MNRNVEAFAEKVAKALLKEHHRKLGEWIGDPASGKCDGDIGAEEDGPNSRENHLSRHGQLGNEEADGNAGGDGVSARMPELSFKHRGDGSLKPCSSFKAWAAQEAIDLSDYAEIATFKFCGHGGFLMNSYDWTSIFSRLTRERQTHNCLRLNGSERAALSLDRSKDEILGEWGLHFGATRQT